MKKLLAVFFALPLAWAVKAQAQDKTPLKLVDTIHLPGVHRKWDHAGVDLDGHRLFFTSEEDDPAVEVFDLRTNKHLHTIEGFKGPHNVLPFVGLKQIFVVDGEASEIKVFDYNSYELIKHIPLTIDADPAVYDAAAKQLFVVNGGREAHTPTCLVSVVDVPGGRKLADITLPTNRLESTAIENSSSRLFVNMTGVNTIGVLDRQKRTLIQQWPVTAGQQNVPMQYDEATHRLFVVTRQPSKLVVVNTDTGKEVTSVDVAEQADDLAWDAAHRRLYVACGGGKTAQPAISVVEQKSADDYRLLANVPTVRGAKTGRLVPELNRYYLGVPGAGDQEAQIQVYEIVP